MKIGDLFLRVLADDKGFQADLQKKTGKAGDAAGKTLGGRLRAGLTGAFKGGKGDILKALGIGAGIGVATLALRKLAGAVGNGMESLKRIEVINAQTAAAIKSTGGAANVTAGQVEGLAGSLEKLTGVEAETVQEGQNLLLTFTGIRNEAGAGNDIFDQTTRAMTDMAVAMNKGNGAGVDMQATAIQLGKALNDPIKGITALRKVGVAFTEQQTDQIKVLVKQGKTLEAQKIILAELNKEFGGSAESFGNTAAGKFAKVGHAVGELEEALAQKLMPVLEDTADLLLELAEALSDTSGEAADNSEVMGNLANLIHDLFKDPDVEARSFFGVIGDLLNEVSQQLNDLGSNLNDAYYWWDGYEDVAVTRAKAAGEAATRSAADVRRAGSGMRGGLGVARAAFEDLGDEAEEAAKRLDVSIMDMRDGIRALEEAFVASARRIIADYYDPIEQRQELTALKKEAAEQRQIIASKDSTKEQIADARLRLQAIERSTTELLVELGATGNATQQEISDALVTWQKKAATAKGQALADILAIIRQLSLLKLAAQQASGALRLGGGIGHGVGGREHGGPVHAGTPYIVGERRPELFVPRVDGTIIPKVPDDFTGAGAGGATYNIEVNNPEPRAADQDIGRMLRRIERLGI